tara:strand:- start:184 stop:486 length:303 start_codon:yes stop_codon:yes gene_type:complete
MVKEGYFNIVGILSGKYEYTSNVFLDREQINCGGGEINDLDVVFRFLVEFYRAHRLDVLYLGNELSESQELDIYQYYPAHINGLVKDLEGEGLNAHLVAN